MAALTTASLGPSVPRSSKAGSPFKCHPHDGDSPGAGRAWPSPLNPRLTQSTTESATVHCRCAGRLRASETQPVRRHFPSWPHRLLRCLPGPVPRVCTPPLSHCSHQHPGGGVNRGPPSVLLTQALHQNLSPRSPGHACGHRYTASALPPCSPLAPHRAHPRRVLHPTVALLLRARSGSFLTPGKSQHPSPGLWVLGHLHHLYPPPHLVPTLPQTSQPLRPYSGQVASTPFVPRDYYNTCEDCRQGVMAHSTMKTLRWRPAGLPRIPQSDMS